MLCGEYPWSQGPRVIGIARFVLSEMRKCRVLISFCWPLMRSVREKGHTKEGDAIAAARRRLPMVEVDGAPPLIGERGAVTLLDVFEGRRQADRLLLHVAHWPSRAGAVRRVHLGDI